MNATENWNIPLRSSCLNVDLGRSNKYFLQPKYATEQQ